MELPATVSSSFCLLGILHFLLEARPPAHRRASVHFFSEISRLRCARGLGSGTARACARSEYPSHSTPRASGSSAASLAYSSAFSFLGTPLCAGHQQVSMVTSGRALRSTAMFLLAWSAYIWPGPGSSEAIRVMAAWAFVNIVALSGVTCLLETDSSALERAVHSTS